MLENIIWRIKKKRRKLTPEIDMELSKLYKNIFNPKNWYEDKYNKDTDIFYFKMMYYKNNYWDVEKYEKKLKKFLSEKCKDGRWC